MNAIQFILAANIIRYFIIHTKLIHIFKTHENGKNSGYIAFIIFVSVSLYIVYKNIYYSIIGGISAYLIRYMFYKFKLIETINNPLRLENNLWFLLFSVIFAYILNLKFY